MKALQRDFLPLCISFHKGIGQSLTGMIVNERLNLCYGYQLPVSGGGQIKGKLLTLCIKREEIRVLNEAFPPNKYLE